jgi:hypothetical protein
MTRSGSKVLDGDLLLALQRVSRKAAKHESHINKAAITIVRIVMLVAIGHIHRRATQESPKDGSTCNCCFLQNGNGIRDCLPKWQHVPVYKRLNNGYATTPNTPNGSKEHDILGYMFSVLMQEGKAGVIRHTPVQRPVRKLRNL